MSHESARGDDGFDDAGFDEITKNEAHFADSKSASESHDNETFFVASHGLEDISGIANLASGVGSVAHGADEVIDRFDFGKIEWIDGTEFVLDRIVKNTACDGFTGFGHRDSSHSSLNDV